MTLVKKLSADLKGVTPPAGLASADSDLKAALDDLSSRLEESNLAIDKGDATAFAEAGGRIGTAYRKPSRTKSQS
jgi:hypothetical protein